MSVGKIKLKILTAIAIVFVLGLCLISCSREKNTEIKEGGIYSINSGDGDIGIVKVLVHEEETIHIRIYKDRFKQRPKKINPKKLTLGSINDPDGGFGIGHLPIRTSEFLSWIPKLAVESSVTEDELEGYKMWKEGSGKVWGQ